jgi:hypothetical protein
MTLQLKDRKKTLILVDAVRAISQAKQGPSEWPGLEIRLDTGDVIDVRYNEQADIEPDVLALQNGMNMSSFYRAIPTTPVYPTYPFYPIPEDGTGSPNPIIPGVGDFPLQPIVYCQTAVIGKQS